MNRTRRRLLKILGYGISAAATGRLAFAEDILAATKGPFAGTRKSLAAYRIPAWFADAKFGIWSHWGPQSAVGFGDWYARKMYIQNSIQYEYHLRTYRHPSKIGYKDLILHSQRRSGIQII